MLFRTFILKLQLFHKAIFIIQSTLFVHRLCSFAIARIHDGAVQRNQETVSLSKVTCSITGALANY